MTEDNPTARAIRLVKAQGLIDFADKLDKEPHNDGPTYTTADLLTMLRAEAEMIQQPETTPLDPYPWLGTNDVRHSVRGLTVWGRMFHPRPQYEQDRSKYLS